MSFLNKLSDRHIIALLVLLVLALYGRTVFFDFVWDDRSVITGNPLVVGESSVRDIWTSPFSDGNEWMYRPLVIQSFKVNMSISRAPWGFHLFNVLAHGLMTVLLFLVARRMGSSLLPAAFCALVYSLYPAHTEPVAWNSGRTDIFLGIGIFLATLSILSSEKNGWNLKLRCSVWAIGLLVALFSKETAIAVIPLLLAFIFLSREQSRREKSAFLLAGVLCLTSYFVLRVNALEGLLLFGQKGGSHDLLTNLTRLGTQVRLLTGFEMYILPKLPKSGMERWIGILVGSLTLLVGGIGVVVFLLRKKLKESLLLAMTMVLILPAAMVMLPALRYLYVPSACLFVLLSKSIGESLREQKYRMLTATMVCIALAWIVMNQVRLGAWRSDSALFRVEVLVQPENENANYFYGVELVKNSQLDEAIKYFERTLDIDVSHRPAWIELCKTHILANRPQIGEKIIRSSLQGEPRTYPQYLCLGDALSAQGRYKEALEAYYTVRAMKPDYALVEERIAEIESKD